MKQNRLLLFFVLWLVMASLPMVSMAQNQKPVIPDPRVEVADRTDTSIKLILPEATDDNTTWDKLEYTVMWLNADDPDAEMQWRTQKGINTFEIYGLQPGVTYYYYPSVRDEAGLVAHYDLFALKTPAKRYGIKVKGIEIDADNCNDVLNDGGSVKYDGDAKKLTLNNANITYDATAISINNIGGVNIEVIGNNYIKSTTKQAFWSECDTRIYSHECTGNELKLEGELMGARIEGNLTIETTNAYIFTDNGMCGLWMRGNALTVLGSRFQARVDENNDKPAILDCYDFITEGSHISDGTNVEYDKKLHKFFIKAQFLTPAKETSWVLCDLNSYDRYFRLGPTIVSTQNYYDIFGDGTARFDASTNTLTLNGASVPAHTGGGALYVDGNYGFVPELKIVLEGQNSLQGYIYTTKNLTFAGTGTLNVTSYQPSFTTLYAEANITIEGGCTINLTNEVNGLVIDSKYYRVLIDNSTLTLQASSDEVITRGSYGLLFKGCRMQSAHKYDTEIGTFLTNTGNTAKGGPIIIAPDPPYNRYDVNQDGSVNVTDVVSIYNYVTIGSQSGIQKDRADVDGNDEVNVTDVVAVYNYIVNGN